MHISPRHTFHLKIHENICIFLNTERTLGAPIHLTASILDCEERLINTAQPVRSIFNGVDTFK